MPGLWGLPVIGANLPDRLWVDDTEVDGRTGCWSDCIITATAARALGLAAKPVTIACTSSGRKLTVVTVVVGVIVDVDALGVRLIPLEVGILLSSIENFFALLHVRTGSESGAFSVTRLLLSDRACVPFPIDGACVILTVLTTVKLLTSI